MSHTGQHAYAAPMNKQEAWRTLPWAGDRGSTTVMRLLKRGGKEGGIEGVCQKGERYWCDKLRRRRHTHLPGTARAGRARHSPHRPPHYAYFARGGFRLSRDGFARSSPSCSTDMALSASLGGMIVLSLFGLNAAPRPQSVHTENGLFDSKSLYYVDDTLERASHRIKGGLNMLLLHCNSMDITLT